MAPKVRFEPRTALNWGFFPVLQGESAIARHCSLLLASAPLTISSDTFSDTSLLPLISRFSFLIRIIPHFRGFSRMQVRQRIGLSIIESWIYFQEGET